MRKKSLLAILLCLIIIISPVSNFYTYANDILEVHYIDVGQGDATLIKQGSHAMLIDAGDNSSGTKIQNYLKKQNIKKLDYFVITHTDSDHSGGADVIITKFDCKKVIYPDVTSTTATWRDVLSAMKYKRLKRTNPAVGKVYTLGTAEFQILGPTSIKGVSSNNTSVVVRLQYKNTSFLFAGDAEKEEQLDILDNDYTMTSTVYKVSHHGSENGTTKEFLEAIKPKYAIISCGKNNRYGHPDKSILTLLKKNKVKVYRTDKQGTIIAKSNGRKIKFTNQK